MRVSEMLAIMRRVYERAASGPLRDAGWRVLSQRVPPQIMPILRRDATLQRARFSFTLVVDSNGGNSFQTRSDSAIQGWLETLTGQQLPEESLEINGQVIRDGGRAAFEVTVIRRNPRLLAIGRASSRDGPAGERVRAEGTPAGLRPGADMEGLARLSAGLRGSAPGTQQRTARENLPAQERGVSTE